MSLTLSTCSGQAAEAHIDQLAALRITVFREWPYLYDGSLDYERRYLRTFLEAPDNLLVLVFDGEEVAGASTALPLAAETAELVNPWREAGHDVDRIFYLSESVLLPRYRGQGLGVRFFEEREAFARTRGTYDRLIFCGVERPSDHPRQPANYRPLDEFWRRRGFERTGLVGYISWQDIDEETETFKPLRFWEKPLSRT